MSKTPTLDALKKEGIFSVALSEEGQMLIFMDGGSQYNTLRLTRLDALMLIDELAGMVRQMKGNVHE